MDISKKFNIEFGRKLRDELFGNIFEPVWDFLIRTGIKPNHITILSFLSGLALFNFLFVDSILSVLFYLTHYFFDSIDGIYARKRNLSSRVGYVFDWVSDWTVELLCYVKFYVHFKDFNPWYLIFSYFFSSTLVIITKNSKKFSPSWFIVPLSIVGIPFIGMYLDLFFNYVVLSSLILLCTKTKQVFHVK